MLTWFARARKNKKYTAENASRSLNREPPFVKIARKRANAHLRVRRGVDDDDDDDDRHVDAYVE